jgi:glutaredoxin
MKKLVIWSSDYCGHCRRLIDIVEDLDLPYKLVKIEDDLDEWIKVMDVWNVRTVPQVFIFAPFNEDGTSGTDHHIGGSEEFAKAVTSGDLFWKMLND